MKQLAFEIDAGKAERFADDLIDLGALSVSFEDALEGTPQETPLFDEPGELNRWHRLRVSVLCEDGTDTADLLRSAGKAAGIAEPSSVTIERIENHDWVRRNQSDFGPIHASRRIWVMPTWGTVPDKSAINVILDPGLAFGTGSHPTTKLCLRWLDESIGGGETVLDYGCGSGILAIAAMKLGAAVAIGVDIDPQALDVAAQNAAQNDVACRFLATGTPIEMMADLVVANILANPLKMLSPLLAAHTVSGGLIAMTGILEEQAPEVERAYERWFDFGEARYDQGWALITGRRIR